jgi:hypothetical protein
MILSKEKTMKTKPCQMEIMWIVLLCAAGNLCFGQSYWKKVYQDEEISHIEPLSDGNFFLVSSFGIIKIKPNGDKLWIKTFGERNYIKNMIAPTSDGDFLITGDDTNGIWVAKINTIGDIIGEKTYLFSGCVVSDLHPFFPTADGNFFLSGNITCYDAMHPDRRSDVGIAKIDLNGNIIGTKFFGGLGADELLTILSMPDGNFLLSYYENFTSAPVDFVKISPNLDMLWTKSFDVNQVQGVKSICPTSDGNLILSGLANFYGYLSSATSVWFMKINPNGDTLWTKTFDNSGGREFRDIYATADSAFLVGGDIDLYWLDDKSYEFLLMKINYNGDTLWTKQYGDSRDDFLEKIIPTSDGNFFLIGNKSSIGKDTSDIFLIKIKPNGDTLWSRVFNIENRDCLDTIIQTSDKNFLLVGSSLPLNTDVWETWLICIVADQYAYKNSLFTYKIPTYRTDSLNFGYTPLKVPSGMTVSPGGTISWTPTTDTIYMDHAEFQVVNDAGRTDTLTFNIFVNSNYHANASIKPSNFKITSSKPFKIDTKLSNNKIKISLPSSVSSLTIYNIHGRIIDKITPTISGSETYATWPNASVGGIKFPTGKYFAKVSVGKNTAVKPFLFCR